MSPLVAIGVGFFGGLGAVARFVLDGRISRRVGREFPYGTLLVNLIGAFTLGVIVGVAIGANAYRLLGTGLIGGFTTFSTWAFESHRLGEDGELGIGGFNFAVSLVAGVVAAWLGRKLGA